MIKRFIITTVSLTSITLALIGSVSATDEGFLLFPPVSSMDSIPNLHSSTQEPVYFDPQLAGVMTHFRDDINSLSLGQLPRIEEARENLQSRVDEERDLRKSLLNIDGDHHDPPNIRWGIEAISDEINHMNRRLSSLRREDLRFDLISRCESLQVTLARKLDGYVETERYAAEVECNFQIWNLLKTNYDKMRQAILVLRGKKQVNSTLLEEYLCREDYPDSESPSSWSTCIYTSEHQATLRANFEAALAGALKAHAVSKEQYHYLRKGALELIKALEVENQDYTDTIEYLSSQMRKTIDRMNIMRKQMVNDVQIEQQLTVLSQTASEEGLAAKYQLNYLIAYKNQLNCLNDEMTGQIIKDIDVLAGRKSVATLIQELKKFEQVLSKELCEVLNQMIEDNVVNIKWENFVRWILVNNTGRVVDAMLTSKPSNKLEQLLLNTQYEAVEENLFLTSQVPQVNRAMKSSRAPNQVAQVASGRAARALIRLIKAIPDNALEIGIQKSMQLAGQAIKEQASKVKGGSTISSLLTWSVSQTFNFTGGQRRLSHAASQEQQSVLRSIVRKIRNNVADPSTLPVHLPEAKFLLSKRLLKNPRRAASISSWAIHDGIQDEWEVSLIEQQCTALGSLESNISTLKSKLTNLGLSLEDGHYPQTDVREISLLKEDFTELLKRAKEFQMQLEQPYVRPGK